MLGHHLSCDILEAALCELVPPLRQVERGSIKLDNIQESKHGDCVEEKGKSKYDAPCHLVVHKGLCICVFGQHDRTCKGKKSPYLHRKGIHTDA